MKIEIVLSTLLLLSTYCFSQVAKFDKDGKLLQLNLEKGEVRSINDSELLKYDVAQRKEWRELLAKKTEAALKNIKKNDGKFFKWLWAESTYNDVVNDLKNLNQLLTRGNNPDFHYAIFDHISDNLKVTLLEADTQKQAYYFKDNQLLKKNFFNIFILDYYNHQLQNMDDVVNEYNLNKWVSDANYLGKKVDEANDLLKSMYEKNNDNVLDLTTKANTFSHQLNDDRPFKEIKKLVGSDWFKKFLWLREGQLALNPLDFTTEDFIRGKPQYDPKKVRIFENYIDSVLDKYTRFDTLGKVDKFLTILKMKGNEKDILSLESRQKALEINSINLNKSLLTEQLLNKIIIPKVDVNDDSIKNMSNDWIKYHTFSFSPDDDFVANLNYKKYLTTPVRAGDEKKLLVVNIPNGYKVNLKTLAKAIKDSSEFQTGLNQVVGLAAQVAGFVFKLSPYGSVSSVISSVANIDSHDRNTLEMLEISKTFHSSPPNEKLYDHLKRSTSNKITDLFDGCIRTIGITKTEPYNAAKATRFKVCYEGKVLERKNQFNASLNILRDDSLHLSFMLSALAKSSLPPQNIKAIIDDKPTYTSKVLTTKPSDDPVKMDVQLLGFKKGADTVKTADFSYKVGKNYRFQLSAGLAYTFTDFNQTTVAENNGKIEITNNSQKYRLLVGVNIYPLGRGIFLQDNRFIGRWKERISIFVGVGIPKPGENIYAGVSYDWLPGLKTALGVQFYRNDKFTVKNNKIIENELRYQIAWPFVSLQIDPSALIKTLGLFSGQNKTSK